MDLESNDTMGENNPNSTPQMYNFNHSILIRKKAAKGHDQCELRSYIFKAVKCSKVTSLTQ